MKWKKYRPFVLSILLALAVGGIGGLATQRGLPIYEQLTKPPLTPPALLFPVVWTLLYTFMGVGAALVWKTSGPLRTRALTVYAVQLMFNCLWSVLFFGFQAYLPALFWLLVLWLLIVTMVVLFYRVNPIAGVLQIPYLLWVSFAAYLNAGIWWLNR